MSQFLYNDPFTAVAQQFVMVADEPEEPVDLFLSQALSNATTFDLALMPTTYYESGTSMTSAGQDDFANNNLFGSFVPTQNGHPSTYLSVGGLYTGVNSQVFSPGTPHGPSNASPNPPAPLSFTAHGPSSAHVSHVCRALAPHISDIWLELCMNRKKIAYRCTWPNCSAAPATKVKMDTHVHKHLGITKLFECTCGRQFGSMESAKRHSDTQVKRFRCGLCRKAFARKDYRNLHQKRCAALKIST